MNLGITYKVRKRIEYVKLEEIDLMDMEFEIFEMNKIL